MIDRHWWKPQNEGEDPHDALFKEIDALDDRQRATAGSIADHLGLYLDREVGDLTEALRMRSVSLYQGHRGVRMNVVKSCIDTVTAKIVPNRPKPMFLTVEGRYGDRAKAKNLEKWVDGLFHRENVYSVHAPKVFLDAAIFGTGAMQVSESDGEVCIEWVWIGEFILDEVSALYHPPRALYRRKYIAREVLKAMFPDSAEQIDSQAMGAYIDSVEETGGSMEDVVEVIEGWHLPSEPGADDGRYVCAIRNETLADEQYNEPEFPFVFFRWARSPLGFYGIGLAEELHGIQDEINNLLERIQEAMELLATAWVLNPRSAGIPDDHFDNLPGTVLTYDGPQAPQVTTPASMSSQVIDHLWQLYARAYEISGVSQLSAQSKKPAGIESGLALQTLLDAETQRFAMLARDWEEFFIDLTRCAVRCAKNVYKGKGSGKVRWADRTVVHEIDWSDADMEEDAYVLRIFPTNFLPQTPAGKLDRVDRLIQQGYLSPEKGLGLLDFPDLDQFQKLETASQELLSRIMDAMLYEGRYIPPIEEMDLEVGVQMAANYWQQGMLEDAPEEHVDLLQMWISDAKALLPAPAPPPMAGAPMDPSMPAEGLAGPDVGGTIPPGLPPELAGGLPPEGMA